MTGVQTCALPISALIAAIGIILMLFPGTKDKKDSVTVPETAAYVQLSDEEKLREILSYISGAGDVAVMLTQAQGQMTIYQTDYTISDSSDGNNNKSETIIVTDAERRQDGLVKQVIPPTYLGAIILCEGADSPTVRLSIVEAVSKVTGLGADRISVLKMK